eukprot:SAG31_NODE_35288_length_324_cov_1.217778_1_plen_46_part_10
MSAVHAEVALSWSPSGQRVARRREDEETARKIRATFSTDSPALEAG